MKPRPCPNTECRNRAILTTEDGLGYWYVRCSECEMRGPYSRTKDGALRLWDGLSIPAEPEVLVYDAEMTEEGEKALKKLLDKDRGCFGTIQTRPSDTHWLSGHHA